MPTVTCKHHEIITVEGELERGECRHCHQVKMYDKHSPTPTVTITKLGRIDGQIVMPDCKTLPLSPEENKELIAAINAENGKKETVREKKTNKDKSRINQPDQYFEDHKAEILKDYNALTTIKFLSLWHLSSIRWKRIKLKWGIGGKQDYPPKGTKLDTMPLFPAFNEKWNEAVQCEWLRTYVELEKLEGVK